MPAKPEFSDEERVLLEAIHADSRNSVPRLAVPAPGKEIASLSP